MRVAVFGRLFADVRDDESLQKKHGQRADEHKGERLEPTDVDGLGGHLEEGRAQHHASGKGEEHFDAAAVGVDGEGDDAADESDEDERQGIEREEKCRVQGRARFPNKEGSRKGDYRAFDRARRGRSSEKAAALTLALRALSIERAIGWANECIDWARHESKQSGARGDILTPEFAEDVRIDCWRWIDEALSDSDGELFRFFK